MRGLALLAAGLMLAALVGCDAAVPESIELPRDYSTATLNEIAESAKQLFEDTSTMAQSLSKADAATADLMRLHQEAINKFAMQSSTQEEKIESLTKLVSTLKNEVETQAEFSPETLVEDSRVLDLESRVTELERKLRELDERCQCGKLQSPASSTKQPVKSAVSGYGSSGSSVSSSVTYSTPAVKSGGSTGSVYSSQPVAPSDQGSYYYSQPDAVITQTVQVPSSTCYTDANGNRICSPSVMSPQVSRPRLFPSWKNR